MIIRTECDYGNPGRKINYHCFVVVLYICSNVTRGVTSLYIEIFNEVS